MKETKKLYLTTEGRVKLDISRKACHPFGFYHGDKITNTCGEATVLGVYNNTLYYTYGEENAACHWGRGNKKKELEREGFKLIKTAKE